MKCPNCDGTGKAEIGLGAFTIHGADCDQCNGKGIIEPMTNEEWFCTLSTEEKAEFSMRVFKNCTWCLDGGSPQECPFNAFLDCPAESKENMVKWLKEKHNGNNSL